MFGRLISVGLIGVLALSPAVAHAGPILDQAMRHANTLQLGVVLSTAQQVGCPVAAEPAEGTDASGKAWSGGSWAADPAGYYAHRRAREHATAAGRHGAAVLRRRRQVLRR